MIWDEVAAPDWDPDLDAIASRYVFGIAYRVGLTTDDVLATGGTARATARLTERCGGKVAGIATIMELAFLNGRDAIKEYEYFSLIAF